LELLSAFGVALTVVARFTEDFRALPGAAFLDILVDRLGARRIVVGDNFKCGRDLDMDAHTAARHVHERGARVDIAPPLTDNEALISSTRIRQAVKRGAMATANRLLGRRFELDITDAAVEAAKKSWYIRRLAQVLPPPGNYDVTVEGEETTRTAVITQDHVGIPRQETRCPSRIEFFPAGG
jgi:riboflavin kinase/FMN adenylyltransferase